MDRFLRRAEEVVNSRGRVSVQKFAVEQRFSVSVPKEMELLWSQSPKFAIRYSEVVSRLRPRVGEDFGEAAALVSVAAIASPGVSSLAAGILPSHALRTA